MDFTSLKEKALQLLGKHPDKVDQGIDKASQVAKDKVAGHDEQIDTLTQQAKHRLTGEPPTPPPDQQPV
jgi:hypothetical protein